MIHEGNVEGPLEMLIRTAKKAAFDPAWLVGEQLALPELDGIAAAIGQAVAGTIERPGLLEADRSRFIYLVTDVVRDGGHGHILVDFIRARPDDQHIVLISGLDQDLSKESRTFLRNAGAILMTAPPGSPLTKLHWLLLQLWRLRARNLLLFHHPHDAVIVAAGSVVEQRYGRRMYVFYHYDYRPTLGLSFAKATYLTFRRDATERLHQLQPEADIRQLNLMVTVNADADDAEDKEEKEDVKKEKEDVKKEKEDVKREKEDVKKEKEESSQRAALAKGRAKKGEDGLKTKWKEQQQVKLSGPRTDFLSMGAPLTCTCAHEPKLTGSSRFDFPAVIADLLAAAGGYHIHIGYLSESFIARVRTLLQLRGVPQDRFHTERFVPSVARVLREYQVDLFITSFPIGGGRTVIEAMCAGAPVAQFVNDEEPYLAGDELCYPEAPRWSSREDLLAIIKNLSRRQLLRQSQASFAWYRNHHTPERFRSSVEEIFGDEARVDPKSRVMEGRPEKRSWWRDWVSLAQKRKGMGQAALKESLPWSEEERRAQLFSFVDARYYLECNHDVRKANLDPVGHYLQHGEIELRSPCRLFSPKFYLDQLPEGQRDWARERPLEHYVRFGEQNGLKPHPLFDPELYAIQLDDLGEGYGCVLLHYLTKGGDSNTDPHTFFRTRFYMRQTTVDPLQRTPLEHYLAFGDASGLNPHILIDTNYVRSSVGIPAGKTSLEVFLDDPLSISPHPAFDTAYYLDHIKKQRRNIKNALLDYLCFGGFGDADPHPLFASSFYHKANPDVALQSETPLEHFLAVGSKSGRDPHPLVNNGFLRKQAPWIQFDRRDVLSYFLLRGVEEGLDPNPLFSTQYYLLNNVDVLNALVNPLVHYVQYGQYEGRLPHPAFDGNQYYRAYLTQTSGKPSPLAHYLSEGASAFLMVHQTPARQAQRDIALARRFFRLGGYKEAEEALASALHPGKHPPHPMIQVRAVRVQSQPENGAAAGMTPMVLADSVEFWTPRPKIAAKVHLSMPPGFVRVPEVELWQLPKVTVIGGHSGVLMDSDTLLDEELVRMDPKRHHPKLGGVLVDLCADHALLKLQDTSSFSKISSGLHLNNVYSHNYFHFLLENLPRLLFSHSLVPPEVPVLMDENLPEQVFEAVRLAAPGRQIRMLRRNFCYQVDQLHYPKAVNFVYDAVQVKPQPEDVLLHPESLRRLNTLAHRTLPDPSRRRRLYLARRGAKVRRLTNAEEIENYLSSQGFEVVDTATLSFQEQMRLLAEAEVVVAQSGAALANIVFARPGTRIIPLFSNADYTNYYLWSVIGQILDLDVVNVVGWQHAYTAPEGIPSVHNDFDIPLDLLAPLLATYRTGEDVEEDVSQYSAKECLSKLYKACTDADVLTSSWALLAEPPPKAFLPRLASLRRQAALQIGRLPRRALLDLFDTEFMRDPSRQGRSGLMLLKTQMEEELSICADVTKGLQEELAGNIEDFRRLLIAGLYFQAFELPFPKSFARLPRQAQIFYLNYLVAPPFIFRPGDDRRYVEFVEALLGFLSELLEMDLERDVKQGVLNAIVGLDLGNLVVIDDNLQAVMNARNVLLDKITKLTPKHVAPAPGKRSGKRRIGLFCRTFQFGPDSESLVSLFREFDKSAYEIYGYSMDFPDRVVRYDREFDTLAARIFDVRRIIPGSPNEIIELIQKDALDVFILANATTFGLYPIDMALYQRVAPIQMTLNSIVPVPPGFPSFDYFVTGVSDNPQVEIDLGAYREDVLCLPGPVICYLYSNQVEIKPLFDRSSLGIGRDEILFLNAGSLTKIRNECLETFLSVVQRVPNGRLVLAPFNPGWVGRSQAFSFHIQVQETARRMGVHPSRITVMSEMSVAEAHRLVDLCDVYLTPFPHGGATMAHIALVQGKPPVVLRRRGTRSIDQFIVGSLGMNDLLVDSPDEYIALAARLGSDSEARHQACARIAERIQAAAFIDNRSYSSEFQKVMDHILGNGSGHFPQTISMSGR
jgi:predicted O-linked N-acetylglucosamine transferase (SPINDLY family)